MRRRIDHRQLDQQYPHPPATVYWWQTAHGLKNPSVEAMAPWFAAMEQRLHVSLWPLPPNENNAVLAGGAEKLGIPVAVIPRKGKMCWNLGHCGMGCPAHTKQLIQLTTIPVALSRGATLISSLRAEKFEFASNRAIGLDGLALKADGLHPSGIRVKLRARHFVLAGGAINSPALLMRSKAVDPHGVLGKRTFLHPTLVSAALLDTPIRAFAGAPQSVLLDHFLTWVAVDGPLGFKLEAPPLHPVLFATTLQGWGEAHARLMREFGNRLTLLAPVRDGFHPRGQGGRVKLRDDGSPLLDYPLNEPFWEAARRALLAMAEIQFAAGAKRVAPVDESATGYTTCGEAKQGIADPQLSICCLVARNASLLAATLYGRPRPAIV